ncbi:MAG: phosphoribosylanthranilate isomerase [Alphaproteobacteria bacterium]|nr:phosphoribosylanthranilate isomerase [Alphaproteobacteria bacterium]
MTAVKICGLSEPETLKTAIGAGARFVGFVFYEPSPRYVSFDIAWNLARAVPTSIRSVGLFVDPDNALLERVLTGIQLDMIQLHGNETPGRVAEIKDKYKMPVMKAIRVREESDLDGIEGFEAAADWLLFDSKPEQATLPGGTGHKFDWSLLEGRSFSKPWMLGGGLTPENVADALTQLSPDAVDVSSGVESAPGQKDSRKIKAFIETVKST